MINGTSKSQFVWGKISFEVAFLFLYSVILFPFHELVTRILLQKGFQTIALKKKEASIKLAFNDIDLFCSHADVKTSKHLINYN